MASWTFATTASAAVPTPASSGFVALFVDSSNGFLSLKTTAGTVTPLVQTVGATAPLSSTGGASPTLSITAATTAVAGSMSASDKIKVGAWFDLKADYGAKCDGVYLSDGAMTSGSAILTSALASFQTTDVGKIINVKGAGAAGVQLRTTIASRQSTTQVTLAATNASGGNVTTAQVNYGTDDTTAWQNALAVPNCVICVPAGRSLITAALTCSQQGVCLQGTGASYTADIGNYSVLGASWLVWAGASAATMLTFSPPTGASNPALKGVRVTGLSFDARNGDQNNAGIGLQLISCHGFHLEDFFIADTLTVGLDFNVLAASQLGEAEDCTRGLILRGCIRNLDGPAAAGIGIRLDGSSTANACCNKFEQIQIMHSNGVGIKLINADSNCFDKVTLNRGGGGTGVGVEFNGSNTSLALTARNNIFHGSPSPGVGGIVFRAAGLSFPAGDNYVIQQEVGNGEPQPYQEPYGGSASSVNFWSVNGVGNGGYYSTLLGNTPPDFVVALPIAISVNAGVSASFSTLGTVAPTVTGTATTADTNTCPQQNFLSGVVANGANGLATAFTITRTDWLPDLTTICGMAAAADFTASRTWVGLMSADLIAVDTPTTQHVAAFRYSPAVDGTAFWRCVTCNGSAVTTTTTGAAIAATTMYKLRIQRDVTYATGSVVACWNFYINGTLVAQHTTNLPASGQVLGLRYTHTPTSTTAKNGRFSRFSLRHQGSNLMGTI